MKQYLTGLKHILDNGVMRGDRTGKGRLGVFCPPQERYDLSEGFPLVATREIKPQAMIQELLWFISGDTNIQSLKSKFFWERWVLKLEELADFAKKYNVPFHKWVTAAKRVNTIGNLYGVSWRNAPAPEGEYCLPHRTIDQLPSDFLRKNLDSLLDSLDNPLFTGVDGLIEFMNTKEEKHKELFGAIQTSVLKRLNELYWSKTDQLNELIIGIKERPFSSRLRVTAMLPQYTAFEEFTIAENIADGRAALTPCHAMFQFYVKPGAQGEKNKLSCSLTMTSNDYPVGRVYNIAQYALLLSMIAQVTDCVPGELIVNTNDGHIYADQIEMVKEQIAREPLPLPKLWLNPEVNSLFDFTENDIRIDGYKSLDAIKYPVAV